MNCHIHFFLYEWIGCVMWTIFAGCTLICLCKFLYDRCFLLNEIMSIVVPCFIVHCQSALRQFVNAFWFLLCIVIHIIKLTMDKRSWSKKLNNLAKLEKFTIYRSNASINVYKNRDTYKYFILHISQIYRDIKTWLRWKLFWN